MTRSMAEAPETVDFVADAGIRSSMGALRSWLIEQALPYWATVGFDASTGGFHERVDFSGRPILEAPRRLMVQCRQIYVYSHATLLGWFDGRELVRRAYFAMLANYRNRVADVPYVFSVSREGLVLDARQDTYSYAFLLFALAWVRRLLGDVVEVGLAEGLLDHLETELRHPDNGGYVSAKPRSDRFSRQNPHMHLFEAALEVEDAFGLKLAGALADRLYGLLRDRMISRAAKALPELHDENWAPVGTPEAMFEPGHHFEWMWLLDRYAARSGEDVEAMVGFLGERAWAEGIDQRGAAIEAVAIGTGRRLGSRRCWGSCEGLKAAAADVSVGRGRSAALERATGFARNLRHAFVGRPFPAGWVDRADAKGLPLVDFVPASTLYHLVMAIVEGDRVFGDNRARLP